MTLPTNEGLVPEARQPVAKADEETIKALEDVERRIIRLQEMMRRDDEIRVRAGLPPFTHD